MLSHYVKLILTARVYDVARKTPLDPAPELSRRLGNRVWIKREDLQPVFSYKIRGAYNLMYHLTPAERARGVVAASAGNHAQGVALAAQRLAVAALIVMPKTTPEIKILAVRRFGAEIVLHGNTYDDACEHAHRLQVERGLCFVHPYDHPLVIAGQGTVGKEILEQRPGGLDIIFVPVGGGGLIAGVAAYVKHLLPDIRVIGVACDEAPSMKRALEMGERIVLDRIGTFADGAAVRQVGEEPFRNARTWVDEVLAVSVDEICSAVKDTFEDTRSIAEPAGALALAGLKQYVARERVSNQDLVAIFSGANVNFDRLRHIAELAALGEHREALLGVTIPERPGSFRTFSMPWGRAPSPNSTTVMPTLRGARLHRGAVARRGGGEERHDAALSDKGYRVADLSNNDMAKLHVRYMVGGPAGRLCDERLFRFEFPERPGALLHFLTHLDDRWNISLFHYRNHGAAYGRVLMGFQVPPAHAAAFQGFLDDLGLVHVEETGDPAYAMFLH